MNDPIVPSARIADTSDIGRAGLQSLPATLQRFAAGDLFLIPATCERRF